MRRSLIPLWLCALTLAGCVYQQLGTRFDPELISRLTPGISTEQDAINLLGKPAALSTNADGSQLLQWQYVYGTAIGIGGGAHAAILFGRDGKMIRVTQLFPAPTVERTTSGAAEIGTDVAKIQPIMARWAACLSALYTAQDAEPIRRHLSFKPIDATPEQLSDPSFANGQEIRAIDNVYVKLRPCQKRLLSQLSLAAPSLVPLFSTDFADEAQRVTLLKEHKITWGELATERKNEAISMQQKMSAVIQRGS